MQSAQFQLHATIEQRHWWFVGRRRILCRLIAEVLPPSPETTLVDIGCGTGANIAALADRYRAIGIDTSAEAVELAKQRFSAVRFIAGRAPEDLGDEMGRARLFLLTDVLEHIRDDFAMLSELLASASPGCFFLLTVPADESLWSEHDESFGHYRRYDRARLEQVWAGLPVSTLLLSYFNSRLLPVVRSVRAWNRFRGHASGVAGTDFWLPSRPANALLTAAFAGESRRLVACLRGQKRGYRAGSSLIALLRRERGPIAIRSKPAGLPPDHRCAP
jgi:SAM-dependent methyltransferase